MTLRTKLIAGFVALIVVVFAVIGVVTELFLSRYLLQQLDNRVSATAHFRGPNDDSGLAAPLAPVSPDCTNQGGPVGRQPVDSVFAVVVGGVVHAVLRQNVGSCTVLTAAEAAPLLGVTPDSPPQTIDLGRFGSYRTQAAVGPGDAVLVNALSMAEVSDTQVRLAVIMAAVMGGGLILGGGVVFWIVGRSVRPLERVAATARQVAALPLDRGEVDLSVRVPERDTDPRTEIGLVGSALNQMLGHVSGALQSRHASETRVRQFVADASHELRTPLSAIRGYAELARRGEHDPSTVAHALRRVESESARMTSLVEDLLLLARLDSGRPLAREEVDLTMLVVDRVSDARVAGPDCRWQLDLPVEPIVVTGDGARLHQVLANLLANARTHTPPGTVITTSLHHDAGGVLMTVADDGPGIPPELEPEIFNRFVRGDTSRSRAAGSTGLGLSIVAAVIASHNGTVQVNSRPGHTQVSVWLPHSGSGSAPQVTDGPASASATEPGANPRAIAARRGH